MTRPTPARPQGVLTVALVATALMAVPQGAALASTILQLTGPGGQPPQAAAGTAANVCVQMLNSSGQVAGVQMDLAWDPACLTANVRSSGGPQCRSNPATGKTVQSAMRGGASLRAIMLSVADVNPIPDGELFCCEFTVDSFTSESQCPLGMSNVIAANPRGERVPVSSREGMVFVVGSGESGGGAAVAPGPARGRAAAPSGGTSAAPGAGTTAGGAVAGEAAPSGAVAGAPVAGLTAPAARSPEEFAPPVAVGDPAAPPAIEPPQAPGAEQPAPIAQAEPRAEADSQARPEQGTPAQQTDVSPTSTLPAASTPTPTTAPATNTPRPATPTPAPTDTATPESGFLGGCAMRP